MGEPNADLAVWPAGRSDLETTHRSPSSAWLTGQWQSRGPLTSESFAPAGSAVRTRTSNWGQRASSTGGSPGDQGCCDIHERMVTEPSQPLGNSVRGLLFGSVAERYERYRLAYPNELVDTVLGYAGRRVCTALEVGAGTGKATRPFAAHGIEVTALEPDSDMAKVLARVTYGLPVTPVVSTFEQFRTESRFDLVYAAAAWHWTSPVTRWAQAVELLVPGGVLALFGAPAGAQGSRSVLGGRRDRKARASRRRPSRRTSVVDRGDGRRRRGCRRRATSAVLRRDDNGRGLCGTTGHRLGLPHARPRAARRSAA